MPIGPNTPANGTLLLLTPLSGASAIQLTPYAARGLTQSLDVVSGAGASGGGTTPWLRRDVNGWLRSVADERFQKFRSVIACKDSETPCLDGGWIGETVEVSCACELSYPTGSAPQRPAVVGSTRVEGAFTFYRPALTMIVAGITNSFAEYQAEYSWQITLEEV